MHGFLKFVAIPRQCLPPTIFWFHHGCLFSKNLVGNPDYFFQHTDFYLLELEQEGGQKCTGKQILSPSPFFPYWYTWNQKILQPDVNSGLKTCVWHLVVLLNFCCWKGLCVCIFSHLGLFQHPKAPTPQIRVIYLTSDDFSNWHLVVSKVHHGWHLVVPILQIIFKCPSFSHISTWLKFG